MSMARRNAETEVLVATSATPKRPRPVLSCLKCRSKKLKCDRLLPCQQCIKIGKPESCTYTTQKTSEQYQQDESQISNEERPRKRARIPEQDTMTADRSANATEPPRGVLEDIQARVAKLEQLSSISIPKGSLESPETHRAVPMGVNGARPDNGNTPARYRANNPKMSLLSHFDDARLFMLSLQQDSSDPAINNITKDLRRLQNAIKSTKLPTNHENEIARLTRNNMLRIFPDKNTCLVLIDVYFENFEQCMRIFHKPSFLVEHEHFWQIQEQHGPTFTDFLPQLLSVLSIASSLGVNETCRSTSGLLHTVPLSTFELVESWLESLKPKERMRLSTLQIRMLLLLPQQNRSRHSEDFWNRTGSLVRHAMTTSLHRDPESLPQITIFECEQRRRLWYSIVELELSISLMCGMPTMLTAEDFTCKPPANVNDSDLFEGMTSMPKEKPSGQWTDTICQNFLARCLKQRLAAYRITSNISGDARYDQILEEGGSLEKLLQELPLPLKFTHPKDEHRHAPGRMFARIVLDIMIRRVILNLYTPFALAKTEDNRFKGAREAYIQSALVLQCYQDLFDPKFSELELIESEGYWDTYYKLYKHDILQTTLGVCLEIKRMNQLPKPSGWKSTEGGRVDATVHESSTRGQKHRPSKTALIKAVEDTIEPMVRRISRPGSDVKDLLSIAIVYHSIRTNQTTERRRALITEAVNELIASCQRNLIRDGILTKQDNQATLATTTEDGNNQINSQYSTPEFIFPLTGFPEFNFAFANMPFGNNNWQPDHNWS